MMDPALVAENRDEILKSFSAMVERAIADTQRRQAAAKPAENPPENKEKEAALEKLKSQYFQRADAYVEKGEYQRALEEIRRIYIVEPGSNVAKEYEQKIEQLIDVQAKGEAKKEQKLADEENAVAPSPSEDRQPATTWEPEETSKTPVIIGIAAVIVLGIAGWFIFKPGANKESEQQAAEKPAITEWTAPVEERKDPLAEQKAVAPDDKAALQTMAKMTAEAKAAPPKPVVQQQPAVKQQHVVKQQPATNSAPAVTKQVVTQQPAQQQQAAPPPVVQQTNPAPQQKESEVTAPRPFVAIETHAEIVKRAPAIYPEIAYRMKLEGRVTVEILIDAQGKAVQAKVVRTTSDVFNDAAIAAAMKSVFKPAMMSTGPVSEKVYIPYNFSLPH
jgi:TonB family protein